MSKILPASLFGDNADALTSSPSASLARTRASREKALGLTESEADCSGRHCGWCAKCNPNGLSLRTFLASSIEAMTGRLGAWRRLVTSAKRSLWALTTWAPPTGASGSGSSGKWATPVAQPANGTPEDFLRRKRESVALENKMGVCLSDLGMQVREAANWPTPQAHDAKGPKTPAQIATMRAKGAGVRNLNEEVRNWPTPRSEDSEQTGAHGTTPDTLTSAARQWPTLKARDVKGVSQRGSAAPGDALANMATYGPQAQEKSSTRGSRLALSGSLNSRWVGLLQGFPLDWCELSPEFVVALMAKPKSGTSATKSKSTAAKTRKR